MSDVTGGKKSHLLFSGPFVAVSLVIVNSSFSQTGMPSPSQNHIPRWQSACRGFLRRSVHAWCSQTTSPARLPAVDEEEARVPSLGRNRSGAAAERLGHTCKMG
ncbi:hypothetical protein EYF80_052095 [Liparis tanakae]|uniref:Uncharacterized protein n=1 Tax=Liparis tanakae TaxID=230148 RepID=A0A4Z2F9X3_9TELE|nr:hypothetical protein EYF80_052095 [Liparis tanakae]